MVTAPNPDHGMRSYPASPLRDLPVPMVVAVNAIAAGIDRRCIDGRYRLQSAVRVFSSVCLYGIGPDGGSIILAFSLGGPGTSRGIVRAGRTIASG